MRVKTTKHQAVVLCMLPVVLCIGCSDLGDLLEPKPDGEVSVETVDFGTLVVGRSAVRTVSVRNNGTGPLAGTATLSGVGYGLASGGGAFQVAPGATHEVVVRFTPPEVGSFPGVLDLGSEVSSIALAGVGANQQAGAQCLVVPESIQFGSVMRGTPRMETFQVFSVGTAELIVNVVSAATDVEFVAGGGPGTLAPGNSRTVAIAFDPRGGGAMQGTIVVGPGCPEVAVQGFGTTVSFVNDVRPILGHGCAGCHFFSEPETLVNAPSWYYPPYVLVKPFDPANSVMYGKITDSGQFGPLMPQGGPRMGSDETEVIRTWILEGATDN